MYLNKNNDNKYKKWQNIPSYLKNKTGFQFTYNILILLIA